MIWHSAPLTDVMQELDTNLYKGLTEMQVKSRLRVAGPNKKRDQKRRSVGAILLEQLRSPALLITLAAALIWLVTCLVTGAGGSAAVGSFVIFAVAVALIVIGVIKEVLAENALDSLRSRSQPSARVIRNGVETVVPAVSLVPGDVILLKSGVYIPADCRLVKSELLRCDESSLTGEPVSVEKDAEALPEDITSLNQRNNMVYAGCSVTDGTATAVVVATGLNTESAKIASVLEDALNITTETRVRWKETAKKLGRAAGVVCALIFVVGMIVALVSGRRFFDSFASLFLACSALATATVQEALATTVTVTLAVGIWRLTRHQVLIHSLPTVATLSRVTAVCADKTGTLTANRMKLAQIYNGKEHGYVTAGYAPDAETKNLMLMAAMCCDASLEQTDSGTEIVGDHTEAGIVEAALTYGELDKVTLDNMFPRLCRLPFDPLRKLKTSVNMIDGKPVAIVKGAPDVLLSRCRSCPEGVESVIEAMTDSALRVIGVAYKPLAEAPANPTEELEQDLIFGGLFGLSDPPLPEAIEALRDAKKAGVRVIMMTGDQAATAVASAREMGLVTDEDAVITGDQLETMTDEEFSACVEKFGVYVRLTPEQKVRVVTALQQQGEIVAATGDGIGDVPVLRAADVGCAMGSGADVARGAANLTVQGDSFATIMQAVAAARGIYAALGRAIGYALGCSIGLLLTVALSVVVWGKPLPGAGQMMWLHLLITAVPVLAVALCRPDKGLQTYRPEKLPDTTGVILAVVQGVLLAVATMIAYAVTKSAGVAFGVLGLGCMLSAFACNSRSLILDLRNRRLNYWLILGVAAGIGLLIFSLRSSAFAGVLELPDIQAESKWPFIWLPLLPVAGIELGKIVLKLFCPKK